MSQPEQPKQRGRGRKQQQASTEKKDQTETSEKEVVGGENDSTVDSSFASAAPSSSSPSLSSSSSLPLPGLSSAASDSTNVQERESVHARKEDEQKEETKEEMEAAFSQVAAEKAESARAASSTSSIPTVPVSASASSSSTSFSSVSTPLFPPAHASHSFLLDENVITAASSSSSSSSSSLAFASPSFLSSGSFPSVASAAAVPSLGLPLHFGAFGAQATGRGAPAYLHMHAAAAAAAAASGSAQYPFHSNNPIHPHSHLQKQASEELPSPLSSDASDTDSYAPHYEEGASASHRHFSGYSSAKAYRRHTRGQGRNNRCRTRAYQLGRDLHIAEARASTNPYSSYFDPFLIIMPQGENAWRNWTWNWIVVPIVGGAMSVLGALLADKLYHVAAHHYASPSSSPPPTVTATLTRPSGSTQSVTLPTTSLKPTTKA